MGFVSVNQIETQGELVPHLVSPLEAQRCGRQNQDPLDPATDEQLAQDQPGLDRLAEADIVGDQEAHTGHLESFEQRH